MLPSDVRWPGPRSGVAARTSTRPSRWRTCSIAPAKIASRKRRPAHPDARMEARRRTADRRSRPPHHARARHPAREGHDQRVGERAVRCSRRSSSRGSACAATPSISSASASARSTCPIARRSAASRARCRRPSPSAPSSTATIAEIGDPDLRAVIARAASANLAWQDFVAPASGAPKSVSAEAAARGCADQRSAARRSSPSRRWNRKRSAGP